MNVVASSLNLLDRTADLLGNPQTAVKGFRALVADMAARRGNSSPEEWRGWIAEFREHPVLGLLHQDPYTWRAFRRPRGYPGDAVLIDLVYGLGEGISLVERATELGQRIYAEVMTVTAVKATRGRRDYTASLIDDACGRKSHPAILSVACGHLREAACSGAFLAGEVGRFVALDQDRRSLRVVERELPTVECVAGSIAQLMDSSLDPGRFDLIYTAGLYDYLDDETGSRLLHTLARSILPGGRIVVANFLPDISAAAYMEAAMDWWLTYRNPEQFLNLAGGFPDSDGRRVYCDSFRHLAYLELTFGGSSV